MFTNKLNAFVSPFIAAWLIGGHRGELRELTYAAQLFVLQIVPFYGARFWRKRRPAQADGLSSSRSGGSSQRRLGRAPDPPFRQPSPHRFPPDTGAQQRPAATLGRRA
jgi:hypothetical protein